MLPEQHTLEQLVTNKMESSPLRDILLEFAKRIETVEQKPHGIKETVAETFHAKKHTETKKHD